MRILIITLALLVGCGFAPDECPRSYDPGADQEWDCEACHE